MRNFDIIFIAWTSCWRHGWFDGDLRCLNPHETFTIMIELFLQEHKTTLFSCICRIIDFAYQTYQTSFKQTPKAQFSIIHLEETFSHNWLILYGYRTTQSVYVQCIILSKLLTKELTYALMCYLIVWSWVIKTDFVMVSDIKCVLRFTEETHTKKNSVEHSSPQTPMIGCINNFGIHIRLWFKKLVQLL